MTFFAFLGALSLSLLAFELLNVFQPPSAPLAATASVPSPRSPNQTPFDLGGAVGRRPARSLRSGCREEYE